MKSSILGTVSLVTLLSVGPALAQEWEDAGDEAASATTAAAPVVISTPAEEIANLYYTYQGVEPTAEQIRSGGASVSTMLSMGYSAAELRDAVVKIHQEIPGAATQPIEAIFPSYVNSLKKSEPAAAEVIYVERYEESGGSSLLSGGLVMLFVSYGITNGFGIGMTASTEGYLAPALPLSFLPFAGPIAIAVYMSDGDPGDMPPPAGLAVVSLTSLQILGFTFAMIGASQNSSAAREQELRDRRWAVRDLVVTPTFFGDGGGIFVGARF